MPPAATRERARKPARKASTRRRKRPSGFRSIFQAWWPLLLALLATPFAVRGASVLALTGPSALRELFPWVALVQAHAPASLTLEQRATLAGWALWAQLPFYGLVVSLFALRGRWLTGLLAVAFLHVAALAFAR